MPWIQLCDTFTQILKIMQKITQTIVHYDVVSETATTSRNKKFAVNTLKSIVDQIFLTEKFTAENFTTPSTWKKTFYLNHCRRQHIPSNEIWQTICIKLHLENYITWLHWSIFLIEFSDENFDGRKTFHPSNLTRHLIYKEILYKKKK